MKILVTSGGTKIPIDRVRDITNMSKGTFGSKIATEFLKAGHEVAFMKAKGSKTPYQFTVDILRQRNENVLDTLTPYRELLQFSDKYLEYEYSTYDQYAEMLKYLISVEQPDIIVLAAAVSDYGVENYFEGKIRSNDMFNIKLKQLPKLINRVKEWSQELKPNAKLIGFKMLVNSKYNDLIDASKRSINENGCDLVVANDLQDIKDDNHKLYLVSKNTLGQFEIKQYNTDHSDPTFLAKMVVKHSLDL